MRASRLWAWRTGFVAWACLCASAAAGPRDMRITEVDPHHQPEPRVEITHIEGWEFTLSSEMPIWYASFSSRAFRQRLKIWR